MSQYCYHIARQFGFQEHDASILLQASPMHDIGKIGIPDNILKKPGRLDEKEWELMKSHTRYVSIPGRAWGQSCHVGVPVQRPPYSTVHCLIFQPPSFGSSWST
jgi:hypothetical protein